jgi:hypothetical protein
VEQFRQIDISHQFAFFITGEASKSTILILLIYFFEIASTWSGNVILNHGLLCVWGIQLVLLVACKLEDGF